VLSLEILGEISATSNAGMTDRVEDGGRSKLSPPYFSVCTPASLITFAHFFVSLSM